MLIGIAGAKFSGKDTCADHLVKKYLFKKTAFADPLKSALKSLFLLSDDQLYGSEQHKEMRDSRWYGTTSRQLMQFVGSELIRDQMKILIPDLKCDFFTHRFSLAYKAELEHSSNLKLVVSDVRFENEAKCITDFGGKIIKIVRPQLQNIDNHQSETQFDKIKYDFLIINDKTTEELYIKIDQLMNFIG